MGNFHGVAGTSRRLMFRAGAASALLSLLFIGAHSGSGRD